MEYLQNLAMPIFWLPINFIFLVYTSYASKSGYFTRKQGKFLNISYILASIFFIFPLLFVFIFSSVAIVIQSIGFLFLFISNLFISYSMIVNPKFYFYKKSVVFEMSYVPDTVINVGTDDQQASFKVSNKGELELISGKLRLVKVQSKKHRILLGI